MEVVPFGTGIYSVPQAAKILELPRRTIARWFRGYPYRPSPGAPRRWKEPVGRTERDLPRTNGHRDMSFLEFEELVFVAAFSREGLPLQRIRAAAECLISEFGVDRPFAYKRVFTDGHDVFMAMSQEARAPNLIKLTKSERLQIRPGRIDEPFVKELAFNEEGVANAYFPRGPAVPIILDPKIAFGAPTVSGTRITVETIATMVRGSSVEEVARDYDLSIASVQAAVEYASTFLPA
jgi:uncharacterized protein (DUF433 family)